MGEARSKTRARPATGFFGLPVLLRREIEKINQGGVEGTGALGKCILLSVLRECLVPWTGEDWCTVIGGLGENALRRSGTCPVDSVGAKRRNISRLVVSARCR